MKAPESLEGDSKAKSHRANNTDFNLNYEFYTNVAAPSDAHAGFGEDVGIYRPKADSNELADLWLCKVDGLRIGLETIEFTKNLNSLWLLNWQDWGKNEIRHGPRTRQTHPPIGQANAASRWQLWSYYDPEKSEEYELKAFSAYAATNPEEFKM